MSKPWLDVLALLKLIEKDGAYNMITQFYGAVQCAIVMADERGIEIEEDLRKAERGNSLLKILYQYWIGIQLQRPGDPYSMVDVRETIRSWKWTQDRAAEARELLEEKNPELFRQMFGKE